MHNKPHTKAAKEKISLAKLGKPLKYGDLPYDEILWKWLNTNASTRSLAISYGCCDSTIKKFIRKHTTAEQRAEMKVAKQKASLTGYRHPTEFGIAHSQRMTGSQNPFFGKRHSDEFKKRQAERKKGVKLSHSHRISLSIAFQKTIPAEWKGFKTDDSKLARRTCEYKNWRKSVYERDDFTCRMCGKRGGVLHPHHIKKFSLFPELRYEVSNGVTLCAYPCHNSLQNKEEEFEHLFKN